MNASYESLYRHSGADANDIPFLTVSDTAEYLGVSKSKIYKDIRNGKLIADRSLDETTMLSPRALQHAYPEFDIAEIFDLDPIYPTPADEQTITVIESTPNGAQDSQRDDDGAIQASVSRDITLSSLELALNRQANSVEKEKPDMPPVENPPGENLEDEAPLAANSNELVSNRIPFTLKIIAVLVMALAILIGLSMHV